MSHTATVLHLIPLQLSSRVSAQNRLGSSEYFCQSPTLNLMGPVYILKTVDRILTYIEMRDGKKAYPLEYLNGLYARQCGYVS